MDIDILEDLGLTKNEIKIYLTLLGLGSSSAGDVIGKSKLPNSTVHRDLNSLIEKGVVSFILEGKRRIYQATDPESFFDLIEDNKKRFEEILPELKKRQEGSSGKEVASVFKGKKGVQEIYYKMIEFSEKEYLTFGGGPVTSEIMGLTWWLNFHNKRIENKLSSRQIFDLSVRNIGGVEIQKKRLTKIRYLDKDFAQFQETVMVGDKVAIIVFGENPYAFLIEDEKVAEGYRKYFEELWKIAK